MEQEDNHIKSVLVQAFVDYYDDSLVQYFGEDKIHDMLLYRLRPVLGDLYDMIHFSTGISYKEDNPHFVYKYFDVERFIQDAIHINKWYVFYHNSMNRKYETVYDIEHYDEDDCWFLQSSDFDEVIDELEALETKEKAQHRKATADLKSEILLATA